jgi:hypothetical protein
MNVGLMVVDHTDVIVIEVVWSRFDEEGKLGSWEVRFGWGLGEVGEH